MYKGILVKCNFEITAETNTVGNFIAILSKVPKYLEFEQNGGLN